MTETKKIYHDDRTKGKYPHHTELVVGLDIILSGWGEAKNRRSYAGWACRPEHLEAVEKWLKSRGDLIKVQRVKSLWKPRGSNWHFHIYVVKDGHPALNQKTE